MIKINYLHYGDALDILSRISREMLPEKILKKDYINYLKFHNKDSIYANDIINSYNGRKKIIELDEFYTFLNESIKYRNKMQNIGYRGFSYLLSTSFRFSFQLQENINFKLALMSCRSLYYPPKLRKDINRKKSHINISRYPAIGFCLGEIVENKLYIFVIQSDLAYRKSSHYREHFRGWRKILFEEVLNFCRMNKINNLYLCPSKYLIDTCHPKFSRPNITPNSWKIIYDQTAKEYGMKEVNLTHPINIQSINNLDNKFIYTMFNLKI